MKKIDYRWVCGVCGTANPPANQSCSSCKSAAVLSPISSDYLRREMLGIPHTSEQKREWEFENRLEELPRWKRVAANLLMLPVAAALLSLKFLVLSWWTMAAIGALVVGIIAMQWLDPRGSEKRKVSPNE